jgi:hypothetical protein
MIFNHLHREVGSLTKYETFNVVNYLSRAFIYSLFTSSTLAKYSAKTHHVYTNLLFAINLFSSELVSIKKSRPSVLFPQFSNSISMERERERERFRV